MKESIKNIQAFLYSDSWLLLAIIYASKRNGADLPKIIAQGDFINHSIFTWQELQGGIFRLLNAGYIVENSQGYKPTEKIMIAYKKFLNKEHPVWKQLDFIRQQIDAPKWSEEYNPKLANERIIYSKINESSFKIAYEKYKLANERKVA